MEAQQLNRLLPNRLPRSTPAVQYERRSIHCTPKHVYPYNHHAVFGTRHGMQFAVPSAPLYTLDRREQDLSVAPCSTHLDRHHRGKSMKRGLEGLLASTSSSSY